MEIFISFEISVDYSSFLYNYGTPTLEGANGVWHVIYVTERKKVKVKLLSCLWLFATLWTVAHQAPPFMGFSRQDVLEWVAISFPRGSFRPRDRTPGLPHWRQML